MRLWRGNRFVELWFLILNHLAHLPLSLCFPPSVLIITSEQKDSFQKQAHVRRWTYHTYRGFPPSWCLSRKPLLAVPPLIRLSDRVSQSTKHALGRQCVCASGCNKEPDSSCCGGSAQGATRRGMVSSSCCLSSDRSSTLEAARGVSLAGPQGGKGKEGHWESNQQLLSGYETLKGVTISHQWK